MKSFKLVFCTLLIVINLFNIQNVYGENDTPETIDLKKTGNSNRPHMPPIEGFPIVSAQLFSDLLTLQVDNYTGDILVEISGSTGTISQTIYFNGEGNAVIDVSSLPEGEYVLMLYTDKGTYTGDFVM